MKDEIGYSETEKDDFFEHYHFRVDQGQSAVRIDKFLTNKIQNVSRNRIQNAVQAGCVLVNGKAVKNNYKVRSGDEVGIILPFPPRDKEVYPEDIPVNILFEDQEIIIVNKKPGIVVHPAYGNFSGTLVNALLFHVGELAKTDDSVRPGLVHRIDKNTSGILVVAKTETALTNLAGQFYEHSIDRVYQALVWGVPKSSEETLSTFLGRDPKDRTKMKNYATKEKGKKAITHYRVIENLGYVSLVECRLETGRTHQIRAHMAGIGHPVFNDEKYGGDQIKYGPTFSKYRQFVKNCFTLLPRQGLHAKSLGFKHPTTGSRVDFDSDLPGDMLAAIKKWRAYANVK